MALLIHNDVSIDFQDVECCSSSETGEEKEGLQEELPAVPKVCLKLQWLTEPTVLVFMQSVACVPKKFSLPGNKENALRVSPQSHFWECNVLFFLHVPHCN